MATAVCCRAAPGGETSGSCRISVSGWRCFTGLASLYLADRPSAGECRLSRDAAPVPAADAEGAHTRIDLSYEELLAVLQECGGNRTQTAAKLGISRGTLWRLLKKYQVGQT